jgi:hypothetical protein
MNRLLINDNLQWRSRIVGPAVAATFIWIATSISSTYVWAQSGSTGFDVAFVSNGVFAPDRSDIISYLSNDLRIDSAVLFDATVSVPTLSALLAFDAVLYSSDSAGGHVRDIDDDLGDLLADYVDAGRGLLLSSFAFGSNSNNLGLLGRIMSPGYSPFLNHQGQGPLIGSTFDPTSSNLAHPALSNVQSFYAKETNGTLSLDATAVLVAKYTDGDPMLAENTLGNILALNALPSPGTSRGEVFLIGDYQELIIGSLRYAAGVPEPSTWFHVFAITVCCIGVRSKIVRHRGRRD